MIPKQEILSIAKATGLLPATVEKDYVLSWLLNAISKHPHLSQWIFKGGTCLKKCYFDTYRFSEDLDFTVPESGLHVQQDIKAALTETATIVYQETGIRIPADDIEVIESINKNGKKTFIGKLGYIGPLNFIRANLPRVQFDITSDEVLAEAPDIRLIFHPYSDAPESPASIKCYSIHEILAEKSRAIYERQGRARDVYDVVNIARTYRAYVDVNKARECLRKKFAFKALPDPTVRILVEAVNFEYLKANWESQLAHQLPILLPAELFFDALAQELAWWMEETALTESLPSLASKDFEEILPREFFPGLPGGPGISLGIGSRANQTAVSGPASGHLYQLRYAARNRLCAIVEYNGVRRLVEPYSLRRPRTGNLLLYVHELMRDDLPSNGTKAYNLPLITAVEVTRQRFNPRYVVEL